MKLPERFPKSHGTLKSITQLTLNEPAKMKEDKTDLCMMLINPIAISEPGC